MTADPRAVEIIREALEDSSSQDDEGAMWLTDREYPDAANRIARWLLDAGWSLLPPGGQSGGKELRDAIRRLGHGLIAVSPLLEKPYSDAPEWTPWSRFVHPRLLEVRRLAGIDQPSDTPGEPA